MRIYILGLAAALVLAGSGLVLKRAGVAPVDWYGFVTALAAIVAAVAAIRGVAAWRRQQTGQSEHDLAKRLAVDLYKLGRERSQCFDDLQALGNEDEGSALSTERVRRVVVGTRIDHNSAEISQVFDRVAQQEFEALVFWGRPIADLVAILNAETQGLREHARALANDDAIGLGLNSLAEGELFYAGKAFALRMAKLDRVLRDWLLAHVGRADVRVMTIADIENRVVAIEEETKLRGHEEFVAFDAKNRAREGDNKAYEEWCDNERAHQERFDQLALPSLEEH